MAAPSKAEGEERIRAAVQAGVADVDLRFGVLLREQLSRQDAESALTLVIDNARQEFKDTSKIIDDLCAGFNGQFEDHKNVIEGILTAFQASSADLTSSVNSARVETKFLAEEMSKVEGENTKLRDDLGI